MKTHFLLAHAYKKIGWFLFIPGMLLGAIYLLFPVDQIDYFNLNVFSIGEQTFGGKTSFFTVLENNFLDEIIGLLIIIGSLLIAFSKEKSEDEFISKIRLESLLWATFINYLILIFTIIFVYDMLFFWVLVFNMFTVLIFFIIRFNWVLNKSKNQIGDEE